MRMVIFDANKIKRYVPRSHTILLPSLASSWVSIGIMLKGDISASFMLVAGVIVCLQ